MNVVTLGTRRWGFGSNILEHLVLPSKLSKHRTISIQNQMYEDFYRNTQVSPFPNPTFLSITNLSGPKTGMDINSQKNPMKLLTRNEYLEKQPRLPSALLEFGFVLIIANVISNVVIDTY